MDLDHAIAMRLEIDGMAPLRGRLATEDGRVREFEGWLQLISVLSEPPAAAAVHDDPGGERR